MSYKNDEEDTGHQSWIKQTLAIQEHASRLLAEATVGARTPHRAIPESVSNRSQHTEQLTQAKLHASILAFHDYVAPYRDSVDDLWKDTVTEDILVDGERETVSLHSLSEWRFRYITKVQQVEKPQEGITEEQNRYRLYLPVSAAADCLTQLNKCIHRLGFAADEKELPEKDGPTEIPEHIREQAPAFQNGEEGEVAEQ